MATPISDAAVIIVYGREWLSDNGCTVTSTDHPEVDEPAWWEAFEAGQFYERWQERYQERRRVLQTGQAADQAPEAPEVVEWHEATMEWQPVIG